MSNIDIVIGARDQASTALDRLVAKVGGFRSSFATLAPIAAGVTAAIGAVGAAFAGLSSTIQAVASAANAIDELNDKANGLGESVANIQRFQFAMEEAGNVDPGKSISALQKLQKTIGEIGTGGNEAGAKLFEKLGLDAQQLSLQGPVQQFEAVRNAIAGIENISERAAAAQAIFGKSAADLIPALTATQEEFQSSIDAAGELGLAVGDEGAAGIAAMNDAIERGQAGFTGLANQVAVAVAPAIEAAALAVAEMLPPIIAFAQFYGPAIVDSAILLAGYARDAYMAFEKISRLDFSGAFVEFNRGTGEQWLKESQEARDRAEQAALENAEKRKSIAELTKAIDDEAAKAQQEKISAGEKVIEQLERQLQVAQIGEESVKKQEQLASAANDAERERIALLQEQLETQTAINKKAEALVKQAEERHAEQLKMAEDEAKRRQRLQEQIASVQPGVQAVESRLLTRGPMEKGVDKIAKNTLDALAKFDALISAVNELDQPEIELVM